MSGFNKNLLFVGKVNLDIGAVGLDVDELKDTKDFATGGIRASIGGASANAARAVNKLSKLYADDHITKILTRMGQEANRESFRDYGEFVLTQHVREMSRELLAHEGINVTDVSVGQPGPGVAKSVVSTFQGGRHVFKDMPLSEQFNSANEGMVSNVSARVHSELCSSSYVFLDPARPALADIATKVAEDTSAVLITDYGFKSIDSDPDKAARISNILKNADVIIVPGDAFVEGMEPGKKDPDALFEALQGKEYKARTIIMSDGLDPVRVAHEGKVHEIPVIPADTLVNVNGAGDSRDGALMFYLARGDDMVDAIGKASAIATIRMQYPEHDWQNHVFEHVKDNPLFENDLRDLQIAADQKVVKAPFGENARNDTDLDDQQQHNTHG